MGSSWPLFLAGVVAVAGLSLAACSSSPNRSTGPITYIVTYKLTGTSFVQFDSLIYTDAGGAAVKVSSPPSGWALTFAVQTGGSLHATAWGLASAGTQSAKLKVTWIVSGVSSRADSSVAVISAPGHFWVETPQRTL